MPRFYYFSDSSSEGGYTPRHGEPGGDIDDDGISYDSQYPTDDDDDGGSDSGSMIPDEPDRNLEELPWFERPPVYRDIPNTWICDGNAQTAGGRHNSKGSVYVLPNPETGIANDISDIEHTVRVNCNPGFPGLFLSTPDEPSVISIPVWHEKTTGEGLNYKITLSFKVRQTIAAEFDISFRPRDGITTLGLRQSTLYDNVEQTVVLSVNTTTWAQPWSYAGIKAVNVAIKIDNQAGPLREVELYDIKINTPWNDSIENEFIPANDARLNKVGDVRNYDMRTFPSYVPRVEGWKETFDGGTGLRIWRDGTLSKFFTNGNYEWAPGWIHQGTAQTERIGAEASYKDEAQSRRRGSAMLCGNPQWLGVDPKTATQGPISGALIRGQTQRGTVCFGLIIVKIALSPSELAAQEAEAAADLAEAIALAAAQAAAKAIQTAALLAASTGARAAANAALIAKNVAEQIYVDLENSPTSTVEQVLFQFDLKEQKRLVYEDLDVAADTAEAAYALSLLS
jgi:hypothetical protein